MGRIWTAKKAWKRINYVKLYNSARKRPPKGSKRCDTEQVQYKGIVDAYFWDTITKRGWEGFERQKKPENNYVKPVKQVFEIDKNQNSLRRPLSETPVIWNFGRIFRLQNGRRMEVALVFLALWHWASTIQRHCLRLGRIWTAKIKPENNYVKLYNSQVFEIQ